MPKKTSTTATKTEDKEITLTMSKLRQVVADSVCAALADMQAQLKDEKRKYKDIDEMINSFLEDEVKEAPAKGKGKGKETKKDSDAEGSDAPSTDKKEKEKKGKETKKEKKAEVKEMSTDDRKKLIEKVKKTSAEGTEDKPLYFNANTNKNVTKSTTAIKKYKFFTLTDGKGKKKTTLRVAGEEGSEKLSMLLDLLGHKDADPEEIEIPAKKKPGRPKKDAAKDKDDDKKESSDNDKDAEDKDAESDDKEQSGDEADDGEATEKDD
jgi:hypothetical protein